MVGLISAHIAKVALMMDQRDKFVLRGISAELQDDLDVFKRVLSGSCQLVFLSP